ncbi:ABC transporter substrate-binding protein [Slackia exigua]|uniref:ABC transporter substrate-binding protein n=1 Tax=Slackia exigua TaxID=84109 RepID=UPI0028DCCA54|nr:ABC transporter substrate-binding protein [Slackia exigua]
MGQIDRRRFVGFMGVALAGTSLSGLLSACSSGSGNAEGTHATSDELKTVTIAMGAGSDPEAGFNPCVAWGGGGHMHEPLIQSTLVSTNANLEFINDLATSYDVSENGMVWTFKIRDDARFTDGEPLTASDVAFTINETKVTPNAEADLSSVSKAVVVDDATVEIHMAKPNNTLLYTLAVLGIVPEHAYGEDYGRNPIGSGRYMLEQWDKGQQVILKANPDYYGDAPKMERICVLFMEEDAALAAAQAGQVDVAFTSAILSDAVPVGYSLFSCASVDSRGISLPVVPSGSGPRLGMDGAEHDAGNDVTANLSLRRAINLAVDRTVMIENVLGGHGVPAYSVGDGMPWSSDDMKVETDIDAAKALLAADGWVAGSDGILAKDGMRAAFDLYYAANDSVRQALAVEFSNQMKAIGIEVMVKGGSWDTDIYPHQFDTPILWGWGSNSPNELYSLFHSSSPSNVACYDDVVIDDLLDAALAAPTFEESFDFYKKVQWDEKTGVGEAPRGMATWVWFANIDHLYFQRDGLKIAEQKVHPHGYGWSLLNNVDQWIWE